MALADRDLLLEAAKEMAPLPQTATRLNAIMAESDWTLEDVIKVTTLDAPLTGRLMRVANSVAMASQTRIDGIGRAVMRLGAKQVVSIALTSFVKGQVDRAVPAYGLSEGQMWRHSITGAIAAEAVAQIVGVDAADAYLAGLLHDIGIVVFGRELPDETLSALVAARKEGTPISVSETNILGISHAELGELIAAQWEFPAPITKAIRFHHNPEVGKATGQGKLPYVLYIADWVADTIGADIGDRLPDEKRERAARTEARLAKKQFRDLCDEVTERLDEVLSWYE